MIKDFVKESKGGHKYLDMKMVKVGDHFDIRLIRTDIIEKPIPGKSFVSRSLQVYHGEERVWYNPSPKVADFITEKCSPGDCIRITKDRFTPKDKPFPITYYKPEHIGSNSFRNYPDNTKAQPQGEMSGKTIYKANDPGDVPKLDVKRLREKCLKEGFTYSKEEFMTLWIEKYPDHVKENRWQEWWELYNAGD